MKTKITLLVTILGACASTLSAQAAFDATGDGMLNGTYYFRQVMYNETSGDDVNIVGNITFNGAGSYTLSNATLLDAGSGSTTPVPLTGGGGYSISASGEGFITALDSADFPNDKVIGLVSHNGIFIGSTTETTTGYNDIFIAVPVSSTPAGNGTLSGTYQLAYFDHTVPGDAIATLTANGGGGATLNATEYVIGTNGAVTTPTQNISGVTYSFSNGAAQVNFQASSANNLIGGTEVLYISPDGNFIFGGNFNGFDMFVGVRNGTSNPSNYQALYYQAGIDDDYTGYPNFAGLDSYFGAANILSGSAPVPIIAHQRDNSLAFYQGSADFTYSDLYKLNGDGSSSDSFYNYWSTADGSIRIGYGVGPYLGLNVSLQAPALNGSGVYLSPVGVVNAASSAPFTAFLSPGEFLTLYGSNLATTTDAAGLPFPNSLSGVQVLINQVPAPVYFVSPNQVSVVVPFITSPQSVAQVQVVNGQGKSNIVTQFTGESSIGVFTNPVGGLGIAAAERPDFSVVSEANPAQEGETIAVYVAGMGAVTNYSTDGTAAPSNPLSDTNLSPDVSLIDNSGTLGSGTVAFSGLAPGFAGLYQINFTVPTGLVSGDATLDIFSGVDSESAESYIPITSSTSAARADSTKNPRTRRRIRKPIHAQVVRKRT
jgi:uncharacterized protein (TIGR03437 family)